MNTYTEAQELALRDADLFSNWFVGECYQAKPVQAFPRIDECTAEDFKGLPMSALVVLMMDAGQPAKTTQAARDAIAVRYLADPEIAAYVDREQQRLDEEALQAFNEEREEQRGLFARVMGYAA